MERALEQARKRDEGLGRLAGTVESIKEALQAEAEAARCLEETHRQKNKSKWRIKKKTPKGTTNRSPHTSQSVASDQTDTNPKVRTRYEKAAPSKSQSGFESDEADSDGQSSVGDLHDSREGVYGASSGGDGGMLEQDDVETALTRAETLETLTDIVFEKNRDGKKKKKCKLKCCGRQASEDDDDDYIPSPHSSES